MWSNFNINMEKNTYVNIYSGDLRISILSDCNMRCDYCHSEGCKTKNMLSCSDILYIVAKSIPYGIKQVRLTGGEPLLHPDLIKICSLIKEKFPLVSLGINTNGILVDKLLELVDKHLVDRIVIGIDYFNNKVSKKSPCGLSSKEILNNIKKLISHKATVEIDTVYTGNYCDILNLARWSQNNNIRMKILEVIDDSFSETPSQEYLKMIDNLTNDLNLTIGINNAFNDLFAIGPEKCEISFFHSLCRTKECEKCARMHMRITCQGKAKPCLKNKQTEYSLLEGDFDSNMRKAIYMLGVSPTSSGR